MTGRVGTAVTVFAASVCLGVLPARAQSSPSPPGTATSSQTTETQEQQHSKAKKEKPSQARNKGNPPQTPNRRQSTLPQTTNQAAPGVTGQSPAPAGAGQSGSGGAGNASGGSTSAGRHPTQAPVTGAAAPAPNPNARKELKESEFAAAAWQGNLAEVRLAKLAKQKSCSSPVNQLADRLLQDHTKSNQQLKAAVPKTLVLPTTASPWYQSEYNRLAKLACPAFAEAYMRNMVNEHQHDIAVFQHEALAGLDARLKTYARDSLPVLRQHLQLAKTDYASIRKQYPRLAALEPPANMSYPAASSAAVAHRGARIAELSNLDLAFVNHFASENITGEVLGNIAGKRGHSQAVRQFGRHSVTEDRQALNQLRPQLPSGITLPGETDQNARSLKNHLFTVSGPAFDREYMKYEVGLLGDALALCRQEGQSGADAKLKSFAQQMTPKLQQRLQEAQQLQAAAGK